MSGPLSDWQRNQDRLRAGRARWVSIHWWARIVAVFGRIGAGLLVLSLVVVASGTPLGFSFTEIVPLLVIVGIVWIVAEVLWHIAKGKTGPID